MKLQQVTYQKLVSFENHCNEQFGVVVEVDDGDDWDECHDTARVLVEAALQRSRLQREWQEQVHDAEYRIKSARYGIKSLQEYIAGLADEPVDEKNKAQHEDRLTRDMRNLDRLETKRQALERVGPVEGFGKLVKQAVAKWEEEQGFSRDDLAYGDEIPF